ncbi:MAG TPA: ATP-dependent RNA helicase HrpA, partial [Rhodoglobus sp.]|nr:ATP-dependent RNA helicase HrpA [Rhodoglobus sp.]
FLLGYLKQLLPRRPDLKVIITSATIDPESFSRHFGGAPVIEVSGRTYPVELRYRPLVAEVGEDAEGEATEDRDVLQGIRDALDELDREAPGDVLVFLSGEQEIRDAQDALKNRPRTEVLPLYGRLSAADQHRVFEGGRAPGARRVVLATNVAETSLTVPGIRYVVDAGTARISRYSTRAKIQRLPIEAVSQASANQRSGRSGRTSPGIAIRLYSEEDFAARPEFTDPEILRTNLAAVILQMISLGLGDIQAFPFLTPPDPRGVKDGLALLEELAAVRNGEITRIGRQLTRLPIDPRLARMVIESKQHGVTREVIAIVAGLSIQDPRERPLEKRPQADQLHARFVDTGSDFVTLLNLWNHLEDRQRDLSGNAFRREVRAEYLNYLRVREWQDVVRQLTRVGKELGLHVGAQRSTNADGIHRSLLAGLLSQLGIRDAAKRDYVGARNTRFVVFPGSALAKKQPSAIMSAELVETSRLFARMNAAIDPAWAESMAGDLVKRNYSEPHWERKQGAVVAHERVTLYGVPIVPRRRIQFARIDPAYARDLFIRNALVDGDWDVDRIARRLTAFDRDNRKLREHLREVEERTRRRDILLDDEVIVAFYDKRIPDDVASTRDFERWWRGAIERDPGLLTMTETDLVDAPADELDEGFPATWQQGDQTLELRYRFEPGAPDDGVTVRVPLPLLAGLRPDGFDWQVPGLREELATALIRSLPKPIRKNVVPATDWARRLLPAEPADEPIADVLAARITAETHTPTKAADFDWERVPPHLRMTFAVIDDRGKVVRSSRSLRDLQAGLQPRARASVAKAVEAAAPEERIERAGITAWDFGDLEPVRDTTTKAGTVRAYPALVDDGGSVAIRLMSTPAEQAAAHRAGVRRLLLLGIPSPLGYVQEHLTTNEKLALAQSPYRSNAALFEDCMLACIDQVLGDREVRTRAQFDAVRDAVSARIMDDLFAVVGLVSRILSGAREADRAIRDATSLSLMSPLGDARAQLDALVHPGFVGIDGVQRLNRLPIYLQGIVHRVGKLTDNPGRDRQWMTQVQQATEAYEKVGGTLPLKPGADPRLVRARWMLEELRLSLFAQHLPTAEPVSPQRIGRVLDGV